MKKTAIHVSLGIIVTAIFSILIFVLYVRPLQEIKSGDLFLAVLVTSYTYLIGGYIIYLIVKGIDWLIENS